MESIKDLLIRQLDCTILFVGRSTTEMPHVDGIDDGVGYGVSGKSPGGNGVYGLSQGMDGYGVVRREQELSRQWCVWQEPRR